VNIGEGMRRLGIVLGVLGGIVGGVFGYADMQSLWKARADHNRFESLMALPTMQKIATDWRAPPAVHAILTEFWRTSRSPVWTGKSVSSTF
jgi:hypothetical protein